MYYFLLRVSNATGKHNIKLEDAIIENDCHSHFKSQEVKAANMPIQAYTTCIIKVRPSKLGDQMGEKLTILCRSKKEYYLLNDLLDFCLLSPFI